MNGHSGVPATYAFTAFRVEIGARAAYEGDRALTISKTKACVHGNQPAFSQALRGA